MSKKHKISKCYRKSIRSFNKCTRKSTRENLKNAGVKQEKHIKNVEGGANECANESDNCK